MPQVSSDSFFFLKYLSLFIFFFKYLIYYFYYFVFFPLTFWFDYFCTEYYSFNYFFVGFIYLLFLFNIIFKFFFKFYFFCNIIFNYILDIKDFFFTILLYRSFSFLFLFFGFLRAYYDTDFEHHFEPEGLLPFDPTVQISLKKCYNILYFKLNFYYYFISSCFYSIFRLIFLCFFFVLNYIYFIFHSFILFCIFSFFFFFIYFFTFLKLFFSSFIGFFFWKFIYFFKRIFIFFIQSDWTWGFFFEFYRNLDESWYRRPQYKKYRILPGLPNMYETLTFVYRYSELKREFPEPETDFIQYRFDRWLVNEMFDQFFSPWDPDDLDYLDNLILNLRRKQLSLPFFSKTFLNKAFYYPHWYFEDVLDAYRFDFYDYNIDKHVFSKKIKNSKWKINHLKKPFSMDFGLSLRKDLDILEVSFSLKDYKGLKKMHLLDVLPFEDEKINNYKINNYKLYASSFLDFSSLSDPLLRYHSNFFSQELDNAAWREDQENFFDTTASTLEDDMVDFVFIFDFFNSFRLYYLDFFTFFYKKYNLFYLLYSFIFYILYFIFYIFVYNPLYFLKNLFYFFVKLRFNLITIYFSFINLNLVKSVINKIFVKFFNIFFIFSLFNVFFFFIFFLEFILKILKFIFLFIFRYRLFIFLFFIFLFFGLKFLFYFLSIFFSFWSNFIFYLFSTLFTGYPLSQKTLFFFLNDAPYWKFAYKVVAYNETLYQMHILSWDYWALFVSDYSKLEWLVLASYTYFHYKSKISYYFYLMYVPVHYYYFLFVFQFRFDIFILFYYLRLLFFFIIYCFLFYFWYIKSFFVLIWKVFVITSKTLYPQFFINLISLLFDYFYFILLYIYNKISQFFFDIFVSLYNKLNQFFYFILHTFYIFFSFDFLIDLNYWLNNSFFSFYFNFFFFYSFFDFFNYSLNIFNFMFFFYSLQKPYFFYILFDLNNFVFFELNFMIYWLWFKCMSQFEFLFYDTDWNPLVFFKYYKTARLKGSLDLFWFEFHREINSVERFTSPELIHFFSFRSSWFYKIKSLLKYHFHHFYFYFDKFFILFYFILFYFLFFIFYFFSNNFRSVFFHSNPNSVEYLWKDLRDKKSLFYTLEYQMDLRIFFSEKVDFGFNISKYLNKKLNIDFSDIFVDTFSDNFIESKIIKIWNYVFNISKNTGMFSYTLSWDQFYKNQIIYYLNKSLRFSFIYNFQNRYLQNTFIFTFRKLPEDTSLLGLTNTFFRNRFFNAKHLLFLPYKPDVMETLFSTARNEFYFFKIWKFSEYFFNLKGKHSSFKSFFRLQKFQQFSFFKLPGVFSWYQNRLFNLNLAKLRILHKNNAERRFWLWSMYKLDIYLDIFMAYHPFSHLKDKGMFVDDFFYSSLSKKIRNYKSINIYNYYLPLLYSANFTFFNFYKKVNYISDLPDFFYFIDDPFYENFFFNLLVAPRTFYIFLNHCMRTKIPYLSRLAKLQVHLNGDMWPMESDWNQVMARDSYCHNYLFNFFYFFEKNYNWFWLPDWIYHKSSIFNYHNFNDAFSKYRDFYTHKEYFSLDFRFWESLDSDEFYIMRADDFEVEDNEDDLDYNEDDLIFIYWFFIPFFATSVIGFYTFSSGLDIHDEEVISEYSFIFFHFFDNFLPNYYFPFLDIFSEWVTYIVWGELGWGSEIPTLNTFDHFNFLRTTIEDITVFSEPMYIRESLTEMEEITQIESDPACHFDTFSVFVFSLKKWFFDDYKYFIPFIDIMDDYSFFFRYTSYPESFLYTDSRFYYNKFPISFYIYNNSEFILDNQKDSFIDFIFSGSLRYLSYISTWGFDRYESGFPFKLEMLRESFPLITYFIKFSYYFKYVYAYFFYAGLGFFINIHLFFYNVLCLDEIWLFFFILFFFVYFFNKHKKTIFSKSVKNTNYDTLFQLNFYLRLKRKLRDLYK